MKRHGNRFNEGKKPGKVNEKGAERDGQPCLEASGSKEKGQTEKGTAEMGIVRNDDKQQEILSRNTLRDERETGNS